MQRGGSLKGPAEHAPHQPPGKKAFQINPITYSAARAAKKNPPPPTQIKRFRTQ
jgi:hypothetical protein